MKRWITLLVLLTALLLTIAACRFGPNSQRASSNVTVSPENIAPITASPQVGEAVMGATTISETPTSQTAESERAAATEEMLDVVTNISPVAEDSFADGRLVMVNHSLYPDHKVEIFDLASKESTTLFNVPENGWIYQLDVSPDGTQVAMAYAAPPNRDNDAQPYDRSGIYILSLVDATTEPVLLFGAQEANQYFFNPIWSVDGQSIYYISYQRLPASDENNQTTSTPFTLNVALYRHDLKSGEAQFIAQDAAWPRLSPDGELVVYIQVDPVTTQRAIHVAQADGRESRELVEINTFFDVDTPLFSPDGEWIYFSAVPHSSKVSTRNETTRNAATSIASRTWWKKLLWEKVLGVKAAYAHTDHNVPADWWRVPINGGEPEKITSIRRIISYGDFSEPLDPLEQRLFFTASTGIYTLAADETIERVPLANLYRFIAWIP